MDEKNLREFKSKRNFPDVVCLFRNGDYYESYHQDANVLASVLGLDNIENVAGFHQAMLDTYLPKLVREGHRIAICEQPI